MNQPRRRPPANALNLRSLRYMVSLQTLNMVQFLNICIAVHERSLSAWLRLWTVSFQLCCREGEVLDWRTSPLVRFRLVLVTMLLALVSDS